MQNLPTRIAGDSLGNPRRFLVAAVRIGLDLGHASALGRVHVSEMPWVIYLMRKKYKKYI